MLSSAVLAQQVKQTRGANHGAIRSASSVVLYRSSVVTSSSYCCSAQWNSSVQSLLRGFSSWQQLAAWYEGQLQLRGNMPMEFRSRLLQIVPPSHDARQTVASVWGYLSHHLHYAGREVGEHAFLPTPVQEVFRSEQGDCKDGALLLTSWLKAEGVDAHVALVRTRGRGPVVDQILTLAEFDHALVYVPQTKQWIDTTAPNFTGPGLPPFDHGGLALIVPPQSNSLVALP